MATVDKPFLTFSFPLFSGCFKFAITLFENLLISPVQLVCRGNVTERTVQADSIVILYVLSHNLPGVVKRKGNTRADTFLLDGLVPTFDLAV